MKIAVLSNIYGNKYALKKVLDQIETQDIDQLVILGNSIGFGPHNFQILNMLRSQNILYHLKGKIEEGMFSDKQINKLNLHLANSMIKAKQKLDEESKSFLDNAPNHFLHNEKYFFIPSPETFPDRLINEEESIILCLKKFNHRITISSCNHTNFAFEYDGTNPPTKIVKRKLKLSDSLQTFISVGSVGYPSNGSITAKYLILDDEKGSIHFNETTYDYTKTQKDMQVAGISKILIRQLSPLYNKSMNE
ncbi:MAG: hypothetical protein COA79_04820 [Planctomycetota bacterium]|nr:MAG: hypothetical protein COA79_04820 [Planctomycetota bacterium]